MQMLSEMTCLSPHKWFRTSSRANFLHRLVIDNAILLPYRYLLLPLLFSLMHRVEMRAAHKFVLYSQFNLSTIAELHDEAQLMVDMISLLPTYSEEHNLSNTSVNGLATRSQRTIRKDNHAMPLFATKEGIQVCPRCCCTAESCHPLVDGRRQVTDLKVMEDDPRTCTRWC